MQTRQVNYFHWLANNVGDRMCGPAQYLWPDTFVNSGLDTTITPDVSVAIIGGGQIYEQTRSLLQAAETQGIRCKTIVWGIGLPKFGRRAAELQYFSKTSLAFSTRNYDWNGIIKFVPCVSCLSPLLDAAPPIQHEFVVYSHRRKPGPANIPSGVPHMDNAWRDPRSVIDFISSGEVVVTSSYHGVYWAQLLGRKVICIPYNDKFETFQYEPRFCSGDDWISSLSRASKTDPLLEEYRYKNHQFALTVQDLING